MINNLFKHIQLAKNQLDWHWGEKWTWQRSKDNGGHLFAPIADKWLESGTDDDDDAAITQMEVYLFSYPNTLINKKSKYFINLAIILCSKLACTERVLEVTLLSWWT